MWTWIWIGLLMAVTVATAEDLMTQAEHDDIMEALIDLNDKICQMDADEESSSSGSDNHEPETLPHEKGKPSGARKPAPQENATQGPPDPAQPSPPPKDAPKPPTKGAPQPPPDGEPKPPSEVKPEPSPVPQPTPGQPPVTSPTPLEVSQPRPTVDPEQKLKEKGLFEADDMFLHILHAMPEDTDVNVHVYVDQKEDDFSGEVANAVNEMVRKRDVELSGLFGRPQPLELGEGGSTTVMPKSVKPASASREAHHHEDCRLTHGSASKRKRQIIAPGPAPYAWNPFMRWTRSRFMPPTIGGLPMGRQQQQQLMQQQLQQQQQQASGVGSAQPPQESMKRVIFVRCPYYPCPQGFVCDGHTNSCRPLFLPDYDF